MPMVEISQFVKSKLDDVKKEEEHKSYDSAIRALLYRTGYIKERRRGNEHTK